MHGASVRVLIPFGQDTSENVIAMLQKVVGKAGKADKREADSEEDFPF
ncbi:MAG: hypothetical protein ACREV4_15570 [Gammaproteobacteria bacterium]